MDKNRENPLVTYVPSKTRLFPMFIACRVFGLMSIYRVVTLFIHYMHCCGIGEGVFGCLTRCFLCENRGNTYSLVDKMAEKMLVTYVFGVLGVKTRKNSLTTGCIRVLMTLKRVRIMFPFGQNTRKQACYLCF